MNRSNIYTLLASLSLLVMVGCATPEYRIKHNSQLFSSLPPDVQTNVKQGIIKLGYTTDMVFLAAGKPNYVQTRLDKQGTLTVWRYTAYRWRPDIGVWPRRYGPWCPDPYYYSYWDTSEEYTVLRVEFRDDKVVAIEHLQP